MRRRTPVDNRDYRRLSVACCAALLALAGAIWPGMAAAQSERGSDQQLKQRIETPTLDNGLKVIAIPDHSLPIATIEIALRHGAFAESPEFDGLSHLYEHMFFKGNGEIPDQEAYLKRIKELGIVFNGTTSSERVNYFFTLPRENLKKGMIFMRHALLTPKFNDEEFQKEKQVVLSEYDRSESQPQQSFHRQMQRLLWYKHPSRKITLGSREVIENATVEQMKTIKDRYYVPNNAALIVAGDVDPKSAFEMAKSIFGEWKRGDEPHKAQPVPEHPPLDEKQFLVQEDDVEVPSVEIRWQGPSVDEDPEATYAADVLSFILSQPSSKFQKALVESNIALNAGLSYYTLSHTGPISASMQVPPDNLRKSIKVLLKELHKLQNPDYFTDQQLENAKTILETQDIYSREKTSSFAHTVSFWWAVDDVGYYLNYVDNLNAVTREDISNYVSEYILGKPYVLGVLLNSKMNKKLGLTKKELAKIVKEVQSELKSGDKQGQKTSAS
ncbi:MAG: M16 family metallopeptidase, partial [Bradymonadaceae bacterium]